MSRAELFWWCLYLAVFCVIIAWLWGQAKEADDVNERDESVGVDQIREQRLIQIRKFQAEHPEPSARIHALREKL